MKALILSGGKGTRLRPITYTGAKQLVPVANRPILAYVIDNIVKAGIKDIGIIISPETGVEIKKAIGDGSRWGAEITYILQSEPKGLAHAVLIAKGFLGDACFVMYLGDNLIGCGIERFMETFEEKKADAVILLKPVDNPSSFGIAEINGEGRIINLEEKPENPKSNLALVGVYIFSPKVHNAIADIKPSVRGELEITDAIDHLVKTDQPVHSHMLDTWWLDTGKKDDLLAANTIVLDEWTKRSIMGKVDEASQITGRVDIDDRAIIKNSVLRGPIVVGAGALIEDSFIGPFTSIGDNTHIRKSNIEHSVLLAGVEIDHVERLEDSLIGRGARIAKCHHKHHALRLMIGDDSVVEV
ncbi:MAG: glucose-1-phosphate thymidylyltransferase [Deltaproteobacteria bacterium]|nr:glucose-1-phosphate thymidylyltransferase [Deltaproteobacteria bacterium]